MKALFFWKRVPGNGPAARSVCQRRSCRSSYFLSQLQHFVNSFDRLDSDSLSRLQSFLRVDASFARMEKSVPNPCAKRKRACDKLATPVVFGRDGELLTSGPCVLPAGLARLPAGGRREDLAIHHVPGGPPGRFPRNRLSCAGRRLSALGFWPGIASERLRNKGFSSSAALIPRCCCGIAGASENLCPRAWPRRTASGSRPRCACRISPANQLFEVAPGVRAGVARDSRRSVSAGTSAAPTIALRGLSINGTNYHYE